MSKLVQPPLGMRFDHYAQIGSSVTSWVVTSQVFHTADGKPYVLSSQTKKKGVRGPYRKNVVCLLDWRIAAR